MALVLEYRTVACGGHTPCPSFVNIPFTQFSSHPICFSCKDSDTSSKEVLNWVLGVLKESKKVLADICHFFCTFLKPLSLTHTHTLPPTHLS